MEEVKDKIVSLEDLQIAYDAHNSRLVALESGGGVADWNQNDSTAADYVKNRPFYSETKNMTVEDATDVVLSGFRVFAVGDTVTVNVDGVEHSLVAYDDEGCAIIGDTYSSIENGEGQFGWLIYVDIETVWFYSTEAHTVSYLGIIHHKIDLKYLPTQRVTFTKSLDNDGELIPGVPDDVVLNNIVLDIPVLHRSSFKNTIICTTNGTLTLLEEYMSVVRFNPQTIEINSNTLTTATFDLVASRGDILRLDVIDTYTKTKCVVYFPALEKSVSESTVGFIENSFTQSVAYINGKLFAFYTSTIFAASQNDWSTRLTVKKIL